eukprot:GFUD01013248.1.p1 GENE.GFUD01013248.1~~GFUD01013248.1.p1  ORF type:complete len:464 (-),score=145.93 GFUD01013248.1:127-1518(-)
MPLPTSSPACPATGSVQDVNCPEYIFSQIQDFSSILQDMSLNIPAGQSVSTRPSLPHPDQSHNSSLGLLPTLTMTGMATFSMCDASTASLDMENCPPSNISLGRYLQPAHASLVSQSEPLSDSDEDTDHPQSCGSVPHPPTFTTALPLLETPPNPFVIPFPLPPSSTTRQLHTSSTPLQAPLKWGPALEQVLASAQSSGWASPSSNYRTEFNASTGFPWDKLVQGDESQDISSLQKHLSPDLSTQSDSWHQDPQDPSFCSGKFSARSTSFGGVNNTRDENFSDFDKVPSFQSQGSFASQYTTNSSKDSIFHSVVPTQATSEVFPEFDVAAQADLGIEFGDQEFGSLGQEQLKCFLDQEEADCLQANPFIEEEQCAEPADCSVFSGVSDKSIVLRNSNLWGGDTSQVNLGQLRLEHQLLTKVSRFSWFNSSLVIEQKVFNLSRPPPPPPRWPSASPRTSRVCGG